MSDILDLLVPNASWHDGPCAEVRVGDHAIRYVRRGSGQPVVVFGVDAGRNPMWGSLLEQLARSHRLVIPQMPPIGVDVTGWLRGFIEGIGLAPIVLLAGGPSAAAAVELAAMDDFTVRKLILVGAEYESVETSRALWVPLDAEITESLRRIADFIA